MCGCFSSKVPGNIVRLHGIMDLYQETKTGSLLDNLRQYTAVYIQINTKRTNCPSNQASVLAISAP